LAAGLCPDPLGELTALPQTPKLDSRGLTSKGREGRMLPISVSIFGEIEAPTYSTEFGLVD